MKEPTQIAFQGGTRTAEHLSGSTQDISLEPEGKWRVLVKQHRGRYPLDWLLTL